MKQFEFIDLTINFHYWWKDGSCHLIKVHMNPTKVPSLIGMYEIVVVQDKNRIGEFWHAGAPDVASAHLYAQRAFLDNRVFGD